MNHLLGQKVNWIPNKVVLMLSKTPNKFKVNKIKKK